MPSPLPRGAAPQASRFRRGEESGVFGSGLGATELQLLSKALDMAVAIGGRIAGAFQRDGEEAPTSAAPAATPRAEAAAQGTTALRAGPAAFLAQASSPRPAAPPPTPRVQTPTAAPAVVGGAPVQAAPERLRESPALATYIDQKLLDQLRSSQRGSAELGIAAGGHYQGGRAELEGRLGFGPRPTGYTADIPVYQNPAQYIGELAERFNIPSDKVAALYEQGAFTGRTAGSPFTIPADALAKAGLPPAPVGASNERLQALLKRRLDEGRTATPPPMPPALARPGTPAPMAATPARAPAPGRMPQDLGRIFAAARFIRTREDADLVMKAVAESPDVQPTSLEDLITGNHIKRAQMAVMKYMPRAPAPPTALEEARLEGVRTRTRESELRSDILTEKLNKIQEDLKEEKGDLDKSVSKSRKISKTLRDTGDTDGADKQHYIGEWAHYWGDYSTKTGIFSDEEIARRIVSAAGRDAGDPREVGIVLADRRRVDEGRRTLWRNLAGPMAGEDAGTISGAIYKIAPDEGTRKQRRTNKGLRKANAAMVKKAVALDQKRAEAEIAIGKAQETSDITRGRQVDVAGEKGAIRTGQIKLRGQQRAEEIKLRAGLRLDELEKRAGLSSAQAEKIVRLKAKLREDLARFKSSLKGEFPSAQETRIRMKINALRADEKRAEDPLDKAWIADKRDGLDLILKDVQRAKKTPTLPAEGVYNASTGQTE